MTVFALVDSGAYRSSFPRQIAFDAFLLGRADFFQAFTVTFETRPNGTQVFHLDAPDEPEEPEEPDALPGGA